MLKKVIISFVGLVFVGLAVLWGGFRYLEQQADAKAVNIYQRLNDETGLATKSDSEKVVLLAQAVFQNFEERNNNKHILLRLRPYLTSQYLPDFFRLKEGAVEMNIQHGECDNAARMLTYLLAMDGMDSRQWDMVTNKAAHTALAVTLSNDEEIFVDPFFGVYPKIDGGLVSMAQAQEAIVAGQKIEDVFYSLGDKAKPDFYHQISSMQMAGGDGKLMIRSVLPMTQGQEYVLGKLDASAEDMIRAGAKVKMTPYWHYIGSRYNRRWVRILQASEPIRVTFDIIGDVDAGAVTASPAPQILGNQLIWDLKAGDEITFVDGDAERSWRRMNSYQGIDQITVSPLN